MYIVIHFVSSLKQGGAERQVATIINYSKGINNYLCTIYDLESNYLIGTSNKVIKLKSKYNLVRIIELYKIIKSVKPNFIYAWVFYLILYLHFQFLALLLKLLTALLDTVYSKKHLVVI